MNNILKADNKYAELFIEQLTKVGVNNNVPNSEQSNLKQKFLRNGV